MGGDLNEEDKYVFHDCNKGNAVEVAIIKSKIKKQVQ